MITITKDTSSLPDTNVLKIANIAKAKPTLIKATKKLSQPGESRTISQILRESSGGFSFRR
ncbi:hypothetical protein SAMN05428967_2759 [Phyllobacterium sp. YR620]|uniref:hypothetical protein n=1 Tax=unclassified Phyllobacterium TaxID=2638441 RepID=UPI00088E9C77|nr:MULTISPECIES: hypothetical protein [unclassified Phyllobacterium]MRG55572.1 hypothetical protein [Phyllobacterium sp. SYP-B3895]SDP61412.1 hypothetical protein SAMN05428967_2759 [Phyllobacterium sp. YR620]